MKKTGEDIPKKPANAYFKFRNNRMRELGDMEGKVEKVHQEWVDLGSA